MSKEIDNVVSKRVELARNALKEHRFPSYYCESDEAARELVRSFIKDGEKVCVGGSETLKETGIRAMLREMPINFVEHDATLPKEALDKQNHEVFSADTVLFSSSAVTLHGEIYNVDGNGNRLASLIYGPKQVLLIISVNKIVDDMDEARRRMKQLCAPANAMRLNRKTPCVKTGYCMDCRSEDRICCAHVMMDWQVEKDRIKVIFIKDAHGY